MVTGTVASSATHTRGIPLAAVNAAIPSILFGLSALSVPLAAGQAFGLSQHQTTDLIVGLYGIPAVASLVLVAIYRQPLLIAWHVSALVFITSLAAERGYAEMLGAVLVAGALVVLVGVLGLSKHLAATIPAPVVFGIVAGTMMPFVVGIFTDLARDRLLVGATVLSYVVARRLLPARIPPLLPALLVGMAAAGLLGDVRSIQAHWSFPVPVGTRPAFSWQAIVSIAPVVAVFIGVQSNLTTIVYLRSEGYAPPQRLLHLVSGAGTMLGALLGIVPISTGSAVIPVLAGPEAGEHGRRYWSSVIMALAMLLIALMASVAAELPEVIPMSLLFTLAGLALIGVLSQALSQITRGPLTLGPLFAFVVASSKLTMLGLGPLFWALVIGTGITLLLEPGELAAARAEALRADELRGKVDAGSDSEPAPRDAAESVAPAHP